MNISGPLWPTPGFKKSSSTSTTTSQTNSAACDIIRLFSPISNTALAAITPSSTTPGESSTALPTTTASTSVDQAPFSQNQTEALITATLSSGPHLWSFKSFWYIAAAVSAVTSLLPVIIGPTSRWTFRSFFRYKNYWRVMVIVLGLGAIIALCVTISAVVYLIVFTCSQGLLGIWLLYRAWKTNKGKAKFTAYMTILVVCIYLDLDVPTSFSFAGILPPLYLFIAWIQEDIRRFFAMALRKIGERLGRLKMPKIILNHPTRWFLFLLLCLEGVNIGLSYFCAYYLGYSVYMAATGIPFCFYGIDKIMIAFREHKQRAVWMAYLIVVGMAILSDWWTGETYGFYGWTCWK
jgi:hypothetical protein